MPNEVKLLIETNNVVERLRRYSGELRHRLDPLDAPELVDEAADTIERLRSKNQSLSDRIDVLEGERQRISQWCDERFSCGSTEALDHISAILRASLTQGGKGA